jgi:uncharacterized protein
MKLPLAEGVTLPAEAVTGTFAAMGMRGMGKTYFGTKLYEIMYDAGAQVIAIDPVGNWFGLRLAADGKGPGLDVPIFGGQHGDIPLEPTGGALLARTIVERGISAIVDVSDFEDADMKRFVTAFAKAFFQEKKRARSAVHLFLEEASTFVPQDKEDQQDPIMLSAVKRIVRKGRNYGIGITLLDQRPQDVNKKVLNQTEILFAMGLIGPQERDAIYHWVVHKKKKGESLGEAAVDELDSLTEGWGYLWIPRERTIKKIRCLPKRTFNASKTPGAGEKRVDPRPLAEGDLAKLEADMKETVERAKAEDPRALRVEIAKLRAEVAKAKAEAHAAATKVAPTVTKVTEREVVTAVMAKRLEEAAARMSKEARTFDEALKSLTARAGDRIGEELRSVDAAAQLILGALRRVTDAKPDALPFTPRNGHPLGPKFQPPTPAAARPPLPGRPPASGLAPSEGLSRPQQRILDALRSFEIVGIRPAPRSAIAVFADQSPRSSSFQNNVSALRTAGLVDYPSGSTLVLTPEGLQRSRGETWTLEAYHAAWARVLSGPQTRMIEVIARVYPRPITRDELAQATGQSPTSSSYQNNLSALRSLGVVDYQKPCDVAATSLLFPVDA